MKALQKPEICGYFDVPDANEGKFKMILENLKPGSAVIEKFAGDSVLLKPDARARNIADSGVGGSSSSSSSAAGAGGTPREGSEVFAPIRYWSIEPALPPHLGLVFDSNLGVLSGRINFDDGDFGAACRDPMNEAAADNAPDDGGYVGEKVFKASFLIT